MEYICSLYLHVIFAVCIPSALCLALSVPVCEFSYDTQLCTYTVHARACTCMLLNAMVYAYILSRLVWPGRVEHV